MQPSSDAGADAIERHLQHLIALVFKRWPQPRPPVGRLRQCRIIAHRGAHRDGQRMENTLPAFDAAAAAGLWGIELDVRWTSDAEPVVFHDAATGRLFGDDARIDAMPAAELRQRFPLIPTMAEIVARYGTRQHLMIEIKATGRPAPHRQVRRLMQTLARLVPVRDFHLMALDPALLDRFHDLPPAALIPIARVRVAPLSRQAAAKGWAGIAGHLLPITRRTIARHHHLGQKIGTGFVDSPRCLFREVSRGVDWIFTNRAIEIQRLSTGGDSDSR